MGGPNRLSSRVPAWFAGLFIAGVWMLFIMQLVPWGAKLIPDSIKPKITYQQFLATCQALTLAIGIGLTFLLARDPRGDLGLARPKPIHLAEVTLLSPFTYVLSSFLALRVALPYLMEEIAARGHGVAREEAGEIGRQLQQAPLLFTLVWGALLASAGEELLFRGVLWSAIERLVPKYRAPDIAPDSLLPDFARPSPMAIRFRVLLPGVVATIVTAGIFGALHHDMKGSVGIVHVVSTICLGLISGTARQITRGIGASIAIHFLYNVTVIGNSRAWFGVPEDPILGGIPDSLVYAAGVGALVVIAIVIATRPKRIAEAPLSAPVP